MGIFESNPTIIGKSVTHKTKEEKSFFNRSETILKDYYIKNKTSGYNLKKSLEIKSFIYGTKKADEKTIRDMTYLEYLIIHTNILNNKYHSSWSNDLLLILKDKIDNIPENKYYSDFFYNEYQIKNIPKIINTENEKIENSLTNNYGDIYYSLYNKELPLIKNDNNYSELDVLENLGGSYLELNFDDLLPEDPTYQYYQTRNNVKKYIKIFKEHIYNNEDHPIHQIISIFNKLFSKYIQDRLKELNNQLEKEIINQERFDTLIKNLEKEVTDSLQEFISRMHSAVKLFYSTCIDFKCFNQEKDDLINLITSFFFKKGNLYEAILNLYSYSFKDEFQNFQDKLVELKSLKPSELGIDIKFCLDEETIKLRNRLKNKKIENKDKDIKEDDKDNNNNIKKVMKKTSLFNKLSEENKINALYPINENENEEENINTDINLIEDDSINKKGSGNCIFYLDDGNNSQDKNDIKRIQTDFNVVKNLKKKIKNKAKEDDYILERISFLEDSKNDINFNPMNQIRNSVNNFNNKVYFFPKLHEQLKKNINLNDKKKRSQYSKKNENIEDELPIPYLSAINLMRSIKKYKTPFEKIILIAAISDQITECASSFWKDMENYIEKDYLFIEADDIMSIFLYIIIQSQMPEILLYCKIINNFTTQFTKGFSIAYNYTLLEASLDSINDIKNVKEQVQKENGLIEVRKSIMDKTSQRISRISLGVIQG